MATLKQKTAVRKISEKLGNNIIPTMGEIMLESGYSELTSKTPQNLTESKGFQELLAEEIKDADSLKRLKDIIKKGANREALTAIDMGFKLKNRYPKEQTEIEAGEIKVTIKSE